jgi:glutamate-1-semialdehyde 2,1-aminomutase
LNRSYEGSARLFERMANVMPAGSTRTTTFYEPYPIAIGRGQGCWLWDVDGNEYIDLLSNYSALIHGHAAPAIVAAVERAMRSGSAHPAPLAIQADLAERICARVPSIEKVRFTNSGTESVMVAVRAARAITGRDRVVKAIGGYHGSWDQVALGASEDEDIAAGRANGAGPAHGEPGIPARVAEMLSSVSYNDIPALEATMSEVGHEVAAILLEPVLGHVIEPGTRNYLMRARELADEYGALLILDEVITLRLHEGGVQTALGVTPDLTTLGKVIGGGLPVAGLGGRDDLMEIFDPRTTPSIEHHGTFNGNTLGMAAGCASLDLLPQPEIDRINALGDRLAEGLTELLAASPLALSLTSTGSLMNIRGDAGELGRLHRAALDAGVYMAPRGMLCTSTAMDEGVVDEALERIGEAVAAVARTAALS